VYRRATTHVSGSNVPVLHMNIGSELGVY